jgi:hypothetical protein
VFAFAMWVARLGTGIKEIKSDLAARGQPNSESMVNPALAGTQQTSLTGMAQAEVGTMAGTRRSDQPEMERETVVGHTS